MKISSINSGLYKSDTRAAKPQMASLQPIQSTPLKTVNFDSLQGYANINFKRNIDDFPLKFNRLSPEEAEKFGYTCVYDKEELEAALCSNQKTILMKDINLGNQTNEDDEKFYNWKTFKFFSKGLNGNGYAIKGLNNGTKDAPLCAEGGLFKELSKAEIKNLIVDNVRIYTNVRPFENIGLGIIASKTRSSVIENCIVSGNVASSFEYTGGIAGKVYDSFIGADWVKKPIINNCCAR